MALSCGELSRELPAQGGVHSLGPPPDYCAIGHEKPLTATDRRAEGTHGQKKSSGDQHEPFRREIKTPKRKIKLQT